jgi:hypothetical protein
MPAWITPEVAAALDPEDRLAWEDAQVEAVKSDLDEAGIL